MTPTKIICLANSRKCSGRCIAGKTVDDKKWIRPVSSRRDGEISELDRRYKDGSKPKLLDIITIPMKKQNSKQFQTENWLIDDSYYWIKEDIFSDNLEDYLDYPNDLWGTASSSQKGLNDRISISDSNNYTTSLYLINPQKIEIIVQVEYPGREYEKRKVRTKFDYNNITYIFPVTDPVLEEQYLSGDNGEFPLDPENIYMCVSMGLPFEDNCYKFVASIIKQR